MITAGVCTLTGNNTSCLNSESPLLSILCLFDQWSRDLIQRYLSVNPDPTNDNVGPPDYKSRFMSAEPLKPIQCTTTMGINGLWMVSQSCPFQGTRSCLMDISRLLHLLQVGMHSMNLLWLRAFTHVLQVAHHSSCALDLMRGKQVITVSSIYLQWYVVFGCIPFAMSSPITMLVLVNPLRSELFSIDLLPSRRCYCMHTLSSTDLKGQSSSAGRTSRVLLISLLDAFKN